MLLELVFPGTSERAKVHEYGIGWPLDHVGRLEQATILDAPILTTFG